MNLWSYLLVPRWQGWNPTTRDTGTGIQHQRFSKFPRWFSCEPGWQTLEQENQGGRVWWTASIAKESPFPWQNGLRACEFNSINGSTYASLLWFCAEHNFPYSVAPCVGQTTEQLWADRVNTRDLVSETLRYFIISESMKWLPKLAPSLLYDWSAQLVSQNLLSSETLKLWV